MQKRVLVIMAATLMGILSIDAKDRGADRSPATAGDFVARLAVVLGQDARDVPTATKSLEKLGVSPLLDAKAPLTDGLVARIAADLGVSIQPPASPQATVSAARGAALASLIGRSVLESQSVQEDVEPPTECLQSENRGQCMECCKAAIGDIPTPGGGTRDAGKECSIFCKNNTGPPVSDSEPEP